MEHKIQVSPAEDVRNKLKAMETHFKCALPAHITVERFTRVTMTAIQQNKDLLFADRETLFSACLKAAQDGLLPDGRESAFVIYNKKVKKDGKDEWIKSVQYMPMISGILKKIRNSGELSSVTSQIIFEKDKFRYWVDDTGEHLEHEPLLFGDRGKILGVYAIAKTKDGSVYIEPMTREQVEQVRKSSKAANGGPWVDWWDEMARKTAVRRLAKRLPMSTDVEETFKHDDETYDLKPQQSKADELNTTFGVLPEIEFQQQEKEEVTNEKEGKEVFTVS